MTILLAAVGVFLVGFGGGAMLIVWHRERDKAPDAPTLRAYAPITEGELRSRLLAAPGSPLYGALLVVIDEEVVRLLNEATEEGIAEEKLRHKLGGAAALTGLKELLEERIAEAREEDKARNAETGVRNKDE